MAQREQADRIFMQRRVRGERPDLPPTGSSAADLARRDLCHASRVVASRERNRSRIDAEEKPDMETNLSLRVSARGAAARLCQVTARA